MNDRKHHPAGPLQLDRPDGCFALTNMTRRLFQMFLQKGAEGVNLSSVQMPVGNSVQQGTTLGMHGQVVSAGALQNSVAQQHAVQPLSQQQTLLREKNAALAQVRKPPLPHGSLLVGLCLQSLSESVCVCVCFSVSALISHTAATTKSPCFSLQHHDDPAAKRC